MSKIDAVALAKQTAAGTKNLTPEYFPPVESADVEHVVDEIEVEETTGHRFPTELEYGVEHWKLSLKGAARLSSFPRILSLFFGQPTTTQPDVTNVPTAYKHLFTPASPKEHTIAVVRKDPNPAIVDFFYDCYGDELELTIEPSGVLKYAADVLALNNDDAQSAPTVTLDTSKRIQFDQVKAYVSVNGGAEAEVKVSQATCKFTNSMDADQKILGSRKLGASEEGNASEEMSLTVMDATKLSDWYRRGLLSDPDKVKVRLNAQGAVIGSAVKYEWEHVLFAAEVVSAPVNVNAAERVKSAEIRFRGRYDDGVSKFLEHYIVNTVASY